MMMPNGHDAARAEWKIQTEVTNKRNSIPNNHAHFPEKFKRVNFERAWAGQRLLVTRRRPGPPAGPGLPSHY